MDTMGVGDAGAVVEPRASMQLRRRTRRGAAARCGDERHHRARGRGASGPLSRARQRTVAGARSRRARADALHAASLACPASRFRRACATLKSAMRRCGRSGKQPRRSARWCSFTRPAITITRFRKWQLWNSIGQSFEEAMAIASLFYEGILDAYPKLKIVVSHGGGYMPFYLGRIARNYVEKPATRDQYEQAADRLSADAALRHLRLRSRYARRSGAHRRRGAHRDGIGLSGRRHDAGSSSCAIARRSMRRGRSWC